MKRLALLIPLALTACVSLDAKMQGDAVVLQMKGLGLVSACGVRSVGVISTRCAYAPAGSGVAITQTELPPTQAVTVKP